MGTKPQGAQDHHAVAKFKGKWYFFYHIALADIPSTKNGQTRIACYDMLEYEGARSTTSTKLSFSKIKPIVPTMGPKGLATNSLINCGSALDVKSKAWNFLADTTNGKSKEYVIGGWGEGSSAIASDATANDFGDTTKSHRIGDKFIYFLNAKASTKYKIELVFVERLDLAARGTSGQSTREFSLFLNDEATSYYTYKSFENKLAVNQHLFVSVVGVSNISGQMKLDFRKSAKSVQNAFVSAIRMTAVP
jgi:hypothetical protein